MTIEREIKYSRQDRDYACYVNGQYIGSCANYSDGEALCDQVAYDLLMDGQCATATELDGGSEPDAMAADHAVVAPVCMCGEPATLIIHDGDTDIASCERCYEIEYDDNEARISSWTTDPIADHVTACYVCGSAAWEHNVHGPLCPSHAAAYSEWQDETNSPILATALLAEADAALSTCPGAFGPCGAEAHPSYAPFCQKCALALQRVAVAAYMQRLADDLGLACSFCGEAHDAGDCPLRRPLIVPGPRACGCCGGAHHIQQCGELRAALFAKAKETAMHIRTFTGSDDDMTKAIQEAELSADQLFESLGRNELISVTAQSFVDRIGEGLYAGEHTCFHIITVVYE